MAWSPQESYVVKFSWLGAQSERGLCVRPDSETTAAARSLNGDAGDLDRLVSHFTIGGAPPTRRDNPVHAAQARIEAEVRPSASRMAAVETYRPAPQSVGNTALKADEWESF
jgi:hypothetical protein